MEETEQLKKRIEALMDQKKPYLNADYDLYQLANDVGTSQRLVSTFINSYLKMTVKDFFNQHRIAYFILRSQTDSYASGLTKEALAMECGFNNRQTFINAFKRHTTMTPSQYFKVKTA